MAELSKNYLMVANIEEKRSPLLSNCSQYYSIERQFDTILNLILDKCIKYLKINK